MPVHKSAKKRLRISRKRNKANRKTKAEIKKTILKFKKTISSKEQDKAGSALRDAVSKLDKAAAKSVIHKNVAARVKSRLSRKLTSSLSKQA